MSLTTLNFALLLLALAGRCHNPVCTITLPVSHCHRPPLISSQLLISSIFTCLQFHSLTYFTDVSFLNLNTRALLSLLFSFFLVISILTLSPHQYNAFTLCSFNITSLLCPAHTTYLTDLAEQHIPNIIALTETWVCHIPTPAELIDVTSPVYSLTPPPVQSPPPNLTQLLAASLLSSSKSPQQ